MPRMACTTDYQGLYAANYYAHTHNSASFDANVAPRVFARLAADCGNAALDLGGGNGLLVRLLAELGVKGFGIDAADRADEAFLRMDLSVHDGQKLDAALRRVVAHIGDTWFVTCLDVAEHIDREHLADFLLNLLALTPRRAVVSISTRPSSQANRFHSTVMPISTWIELLSLAGFAVSDCEPLQSIRSQRIFSGADENLVAVSHWQRVNPFSDHTSHQHYLVLDRVHGRTPDPASFRQQVRVILDIAYRDQKRRQVASEDLPPLVYNVHFIQDWSFARSLMDVWPADRIRILFRRDSIPEPYLHMIRNTCVRNGVGHQVADNVASGAQVLDEWIKGTTLFVTATEGVNMLPHAFNSMLAIEAGRRRATTVCMQHGMNVGRAFLPASELWAAWDAGSAATLGSGELGQRAISMGSVKFQDALCPGVRLGVARRFGGRANGLKRSVLIGLNLHWQVHAYGAAETVAWLHRLSARNPEVLFLLRTHPDDAAAYEHPDILALPNVLVVDEMALLSMDIPVARLLRDVDGVITTSSTLILDALAASKPVVLLPSQHRWDAPGDLFHSVSTPLVKGASLPVVNSEDWAAGRLPDGLDSPISVDHDWFAPSRNAVGNLAALAAATVVSPPESSLVHASLISTLQRLDLDTNPHSDRTRLARAITDFLGTTAAA